MSSPKEKGAFHGRGMYSSEVREHSGCQQDGSRRAGMGMVLLWVQQCQTAHHEAGVTEETHTPQQPPMATIFCYSLMASFSADEQIIHLCGDSLMQKQLCLKYINTHQESVNQGQSHVVCILSVVPVNWSCSWRQHMCYMCLPDGAEISVPILLQCGDPTAKEGLLHGRVWEWKEESVVRWKCKVKEIAGAIRKWEGAPWIPGRAVEMDSIRNIGKLITHFFCTVSVRGKKTCVLISFLAWIWRF